MAHQAGVYLVAGVWTVLFYLWQDAFILETGQGIYVWEGKKSTRNEKNQAFKDAQVSDSLSAVILSISTLLDFQNCECCEKELKLQFP